MLLYELLHLLIYNIDRHTDKSNKLYMKGLMYRILLLVIQHIVESRTNIHLQTDTSSLHTTLDSLDKTTQESSTQGNPRGEPWAQEDPRGLRVLSGLRGKP